MDNVVEFLKDNKWKVVAVVVTLVLFVAFLASAKAAEVDRAPLSVTQERVLNAGETEFFYTYENVKENGNVVGQHDFGGLWAPYNFVTVGASTNYNDTRNNSFGDIFLFATAQDNFFGLDVRPSFGVSVPNGFSNVDFLEPTSSGTFDLQPALTVVGDLGVDTGVQVGLQYVGVFRTGNNDLGFRYGDENTAKGWVSIQPWEVASVYALVEAQFVGSANGPVLAGNSEAVHIGAGANVYLAGFKVSGEAMIPIVENFSGIRSRLNEQRVFRVGVQRTF